MHRLTMQQIQERYEADVNLAHLRDNDVAYVPGRGSLTPKVMIIGEAPGYWENHHRMPFVGPSGMLLLKLMCYANLDLTNCYLTNVVKYRPLDKFNNNRTPTSTEIKASLPYLYAEWELLKRPKTIIALGAVAKSVYNVKGNMLLIAGKRVVTPDHLIIPMVHPSYILREPFKEEYHEKLWRKLRDLSI